MKTFYVCSFGGSGSTLLANSLKPYGRVEHIHSRNPPIELEYIGNNEGGNTYYEWFNGIKVPESELNNISVIFIYRDPIKAIYSRYIPYYEDCHKRHMDHVQTNRNIQLKDVLSQKKDLFGITEFYNNYTTRNEKKNYKIHCVKYEELFEKQDELSHLLEIGPLQLHKKETMKNYSHYAELAEIYKDLIDDMNNRSFIETV
jgi:hypothetical protein